jgi:hypothetical protein
VSLQTHSLLTSIMRQHIPPDKLSLELEKFLYLTNVSEAVKDNLILC